MKKMKKTLLSLQNLVINLLIRAVKCPMLALTEKRKNFFDFPIYLISFNRLSFLKQSVEWLKKYGYTNIMIIDNNSDYPPLLDYLDECGCKVFHMKKNYGYKVFYKHPKFFFARNFSFYVISDPDLTPIENCPSDFVELFVKTMKKHPFFSKVGFSLKLDDIPNSYYLKEEVLTWEGRFYKKIIDNDPVFMYDAPIDTTFALNSPSLFVSYTKRFLGIRTGAPYQVRHLPWYGEKQTDELLHYQKTIRKDVSNWNGNISKEHMQKRMKKHM